MAAASNYANLVQELYLAYFGRPADQGGWQNLEAAFSAAHAPTDAAGLYAAYSSNAAVKGLVDAFGTSTESTALYAGASSEAFVNDIFESLFNRPAANAGLEFWAGALDAGTITRGEAALAIAAGAQLNASAQGMIDAQTVANKIQAATMFTTDLGLTSQHGDEYVGAAAAAEARLFIAGVTNSTTLSQISAAAQVTVSNLNEVYVGPPYALTTGVDTLVGGSSNNIFDAILDNAAGIAAGGQAQTLNSGDSITGGPSGNTLNLTDFGIGGTMTLPLEISLVGLTDINIASKESVIYDFSSWSSLTQVNVNYVTGDADLTVANDMGIRVSGNAGNVTITGGDNDYAGTDATHTVSISSSASTFQAMVGDNAGTISDTSMGAAVSIFLGAGADTVTLGAKATGTVTIPMHTAADTIVLGPSGASLTGIVILAGLNNTGDDAITFASERAYTLGGFEQVTQADVVATGANPALLASWVAAADGAAGSGVTGGAHSLTWFQFAGQTYLLESVAGQTLDAGTMAPGNTLVELTGTGYTFSHALGNGGTVHLLG